MRCNWNWKKKTSNARIECKIVFWCLLVCAHALLPLFLYYFEMFRWNGSSVNNILDNITWTSTHSVRINKSIFLSVFGLSKFRLQIKYKLNKSKIQLNIIRKKSSFVKLFKFCFSVYFTCNLSSCVFRNFAWYHLNTTFEIKKKKNKLKNKRETKDK